VRPRYEFEEILLTLWQFVSSVLENSASATAGMDFTLRAIIIAVQKSRRWYAPDQDRPTERRSPDGSAGRALSAEGFSASSQDTGGGMVCVILKRIGGGEIAWRLADVNWGVSVRDEDGDIISGIETECSGDTDDIAKIVAAFKKPSIDNGAVYSRA
jgi:hypothetical protein